MTIALQATANIADYSGVSIFSEKNLAEVTLLVPGLGGIMDIIPNVILEIDQLIAKKYPTTNNFCREVTSLRDQTYRLKMGIVRDMTSATAGLAIVGASPLSLLIIGGISANKIYNKVYKIFQNDLREKQIDNEFRNKGRDLNTCVSKYNSAIEKALKKS